MKTICNGERFVIVKHLLRGLSPHLLVQKNVDGQFPRLGAMISLLADKERCASIVSGGANALCSESVALHLNLQCPPFITDEGTSVPSGIANILNPD